MDENTSVLNQRVEDPKLIATLDRILRPRETSIGYDGYRYSMDYYPVVGTEDLYKRVWSVQVPYCEIDTSSELLDHLNPEAGVNTVVIYKDHYYRKTAWGPFGYGIPRQVRRWALLGPVNLNRKECCQDTSTSERLADGSIEHRHQRSCQNRDGHGDRFELVVNEPAPESKRKTRFTFAYQRYGEERKAHAGFITFMEINPHPLTENPGLTLWGILHAFLHLGGDGTFHKESFDGVQIHIEGTTTVTGSNYSFLSPHGSFGHRTTQGVIEFTKEPPPSDSEFADLRVVAAIAESVLCEEEGICSPGILAVGIRVIHKHGTLNPCDEEAMAAIIGHNHANDDARNKAEASEPSVAGSELQHN